MSALEAQTEGQKLPTKAVAKVFVNQGNTFMVTDEPEPFEYHKTLPPGVYTLVSTMEGYFFNRRDDFNIDHKVYGLAPDRAKRIINTFGDRTGNTGVLLEGDKGSGKTLLAKVIAKDFVDAGGVAILIGGGYYGAGFNEVLSNIAQPAVILFDEFEKMYDTPEKQNQLLSLFDGIYSVKKLFVVTVNEIHKVSNFFKNRPGRFMYRYKYAGLEEKFVREYCLDNLKDQTKLNSIVSFSMTAYSFNFDMLKHIVEDMNRYGEGIAEVLTHLNIENEAQRSIPMRLAEVLDPSGAQLELTKDELETNFAIIPFGYSQISLQRREVTKPMEERNALEATIAADMVENATKGEPFERLSLGVLRNLTERTDPDSFFAVDYDSDEEEKAEYIKILKGAGAKKAKFYFNGGTDLQSFTPETIVLRNQFGQFTFNRYEAPKQVSKSWESL